MIVSTDLERKIQLIIFIDQQRLLNASKTFPNVGYLLATVISIRFVLSNWCFCFNGKKLCIQLIHFSSVQNNAIFTFKQNNLELIVDFFSSCKTIYSCQTVFKPSIENSFIGYFPDTFVSVLLLHWFAGSLAGFFPNRSC